MRELASDIPTVAWLITLPQLTSRICHPKDEVASVLQVRFSWGSMPHARLDGV